MSLLAIKQHMMQVKVTNVERLCLLFKTDAETLRCWLKHWMNKGKIRICLHPATACGTTCFQCPGKQKQGEWYEWVF